MHSFRPGPRKAGLGAILLAAATFIPAGHPAADTFGSSRSADEAPPSRSAVVDALDGEVKALSAFSTTSTFAEVAALHLDGVPWPAKAPPMREIMPDAVGEVAPLFADPGNGRLDGPTLDRIRVGEPTAEWRCLAEAMYFEARGEGIQGQQAVAEVILNRVDSDHYPDTVCGVVRQGVDNTTCQFSYYCDGKAERIRNRRVFDRIGKLAWLMLEGRARTLTDAALYFHSVSVSPSWSRKYVRTAKIGRHVFYRPKMALSEK